MHTSFIIASVHEKAVEKHMMIRFRVVFFIKMMQTAFRLLETESNGPW